MMRDRHQTVLQFAQALDDEDYAAASSLLRETCAYLCRGALHRGPQAVIASYRGNGQAAESFDSIRYCSRVTAEAGGQFRILFSDHITHCGQHFSFHCEQLVDTDDEGRIVRIEHVDLPGQVAALSDFKARTGLRGEEPE